MKVREQLVFDSTRESRKEYLTRIAFYLDILRNHPEELIHFPELEDFTPEEARCLQEYVFSLCFPQVKAEAGALAKRYGLRDEVTTIIDYLWPEVYAHLHEFNNPDYLEGKATYSFETFIKIYGPYAARQVQMELTGTNTHSLNRLFQVKRALRKAAAELDKEIDDVTNEEAEKFQEGCQHLSADMIRQIRLYEKPSSIDDDDREVEAEGADPLSAMIMDEDREEISGYLHEKMHPVKSAVLLKKWRTKEDALTSKEIAVDPDFIALCRVDEKYKEKLRKGDVTFCRYKSKTGKAPVILENTEHVDPRWIDDINKAALKEIGNYALSVGIELTRLGEILKELANDGM